MREGAELRARYTRVDLSSSHDHGCRGLTDLIGILLFLPFYANNNKYHRRRAQFVQYYLRLSPPFLSAFPTLFMRLSQCITFL